MSIRQIRSPSKSSHVSMASRVVPAISLTIVRGSPAMALNSDDLPAFGRPTMATGVSAETHRGIKDLLATVARLDGLYRAHIPTRELNRALKDLAGDRPTPMKHGKRLKMYYIAQFGTSPPRIAIEINDRTIVTRDFGFLVENRLRARFGLDGVPLVIDFKGKR